MKPTTFNASRYRSRGAVLALIALAGLLLSGCLNANASMTITKDDTVSGQLLVAVQTPPGQPPFSLRPPPEFADRVQVSPYSAQGRNGSRLSFQDISFDEAEQLSRALSPPNSRFQLHLHRSGSLVVFDGNADLTPLADTDSSVVVEVSGPGQITATNGRESAGTVRWEAEPGEVTPMSARYQFVGSTGQDWIGWAIVVTMLTLGVAIAVGVLAQRTHRESNVGQLL